MNIDNLGVSGDGEEELHAEKHQRVLRCLQRAQYGLDGRRYKGAICMQYPLRSHSLATSEQKDLFLSFFEKDLLGATDAGLPPPNVEVFCIHGSQVLALFVMLLMMT